MNAKQARFCAEYLVDLNATQAAIRAGYSAKTAHAQGHRLLRDAEVQTRLDELRTRRAERVEVKADDVLRELLHLSTVDIGAAFAEDGTPLPLKDIPEKVRRALSGVEVTTKLADDGRVATVTKLRFWDKTKGLELLGKHLKLFTEKVEHSGQVTLEQLLAEVEKKP